MQWFTNTINPHLLTTKRGKRIKCYVAEICKALAKKKKKKAYGSITCVYVPVMVVPFQMCKMPMHEALAHLHTIRWTTGHFSAFQFSLKYCCPSSIVYGCCLNMYYF